MVTKRTILFFFCMNVFVQISAMDQISQEDPIDTAIKRLVQGRLCESMPGKKGYVRPKEPLKIVDIVAQIIKQRDEELKKRKEEIRQKMNILKIQIADKKQKQIEIDQRTQDKMKREERTRLCKQNANKK